MSLPAQLPLCQWLVPGCLKDAAAQLSTWQERQGGGVPIGPFEEEGTDTDISICLRSPRWGEFGRIRLAYVDQGQTMLYLYWPPYPTPAETAVYEDQIRSVLPQPGSVLRMLDMFGSEKALPYLATRLHERRLSDLDVVRVSLTYLFGGVAIAPVLMDEHFPVAAKNQSDILPIPTPRKQLKRDILQTNESDTRLLKLWSDGLSIKQIAMQTGKIEKTILNRLSLLRKTLGEQTVPRRR